MTPRLLSFVLLSSGFVGSLQAGAGMSSMIETKPDLITESGEVRNEPEAREASAGIDERNGSAAVTDVRSHNAAPVSDLGEAQNHTLTSADAAATTSASNVPEEPKKKFANLNTIEQAERVQQYLDDTRELLQQTHRTDNPDLREWQEAQSRIDKAKAWSDKIINTSKGGTVVSLLSKWFLNRKDKAYTYEEVAAAKQVNARVKALEEATLPALKASATMREALKSSYMQSYAPHVQESAPASSWFSWLSSKERPPTLVDRIEDAKAAEATSLAAWADAKQKIEGQLKNLQSEGAPDSELHQIIQDELMHLQFTEKEALRELTFFKEQREFEKALRDLQDAERESGKLDSEKREIVRNTLSRLTGIVSEIKKSENYRAPKDAWNSNTKRLDYIIAVDKAFRQELRMDWEIGFYNKYKNNKNEKKMRDDIADEGIKAVALWEKAIEAKRASLSPEQLERIEAYPNVTLAKEEVFAKQRIEEMQTRMEQINRKYWSNTLSSSSNDDDEPGFEE